MQDLIDANQGTELAAYLSAILDNDVSVEKANALLNGCIKI